MSLQGDQKNLKGLDEKNDQRFNLFDRVVHNKNAMVSENYEKHFNQEIQKEIKILRNFSRSIKQKLTEMPTLMNEPMKELKDCETIDNTVKALYTDSISELKNNKKKFVEFFNSFVKNSNIEATRFLDVVVITDSDSDTDECKDDSIKYHEDKD